MRLGRKTVEVLRHAATGLSLTPIGTYRLTREFRSAERRGLIVMDPHRRVGFGGAVWVLTTKGREALDAYDAAERARYPFVGPITDEMF